MHLTSNRERDLPIDNLMQVKSEGVSVYMYT